MSAITPSSDLYLLKVPIEIDNSNQLTFSNATAQYAYFSSCPKIGETDFTYQRKDGVIRYPAHIDSIINYNYVMYRNDNYSNKWFYAFIDGMRYVNDGMTEISIKTDVWQTWCFDLEFKQSFVEREHVNDDTIGKHTVDEGIATGEYEINDIKDIPIHELSSGTVWWYCFAVTNFPYEDRSLNLSNLTQNLIGDVYNGMTMFAVSTVADARTVLDLYAAEDSGTTSDAIQNIYMIPECCIAHSNDSTDSATIRNGIVNPTSVKVYKIKNSYESDDYVIKQPNFLSNGYIPKNNKLFCWPYSYIYLTNNAGSSTTYKWEDFPLTQISSRYTPTITYKKSVIGCASLSAKLRFTSYKNHTETTGDNGSRSYSFGLNFAKVPICAWVTDYYTNWLTLNANNVSTQKIGAIASGLGSAVGGNATSAIGSAIQVGVQLDMIENQVENAQKIPDQANGDLNAGDVIFNELKSSISLYEMTVREERAKIIDGYFSAFGYKVNQFKVPNITGRTNWNYVKTIGCNVHAYAPQEDVNEIKEMFNNGVTFWHNPATFLDYSQNNTIIQ